MGLSDIHHLKKLWTLYAKIPGVLLLTSITSSRGFDIPFQPLQVQAHFIRDGLPLFLKSRVLEFSWRHWQLQVTHHKGSI